MSFHALQVRFVQLAPNEALIALAAAHYRQMRGDLQGPDECAVSVERDPQDPLFAKAVVRILDRGRARAEASASHREPEVALGIALSRARAQLMRMAS